MAKQNEDKMLNFFVKAFNEVLVPVLDDQTNKMNSLDQKVTEMAETVDAHTASLMRLEKMPQLLGDIYDEVKEIRPKIRNHEERISALEGKIVHS